jgi:hypothetical protein
MKVGTRARQFLLQSAIRRISLILLLFIGMNSVGNSVFFTTAYAAQTGQICTKFGTKDGSLVCTTVKGRLIWQLTKKKQTISVQYPHTASITSPVIAITFSDTSGLPVTTTSISLRICSVRNNSVSPLVPGNCLIRLAQKGNAQYLSATSKDITIIIQGENLISFTPANSIPLSNGTYSLAGTSTAGLPMAYESLTPDICAVSDSTLTLIKLGNCTVRASQSGSSLYSAALYVDASITIQGTNQISLTLPSSLLLSSGPYSLSGTSTSGLPLTYESLTPDICSVSATILTFAKFGVCTIRASQNGSALYPVALLVEVSVTITDVRVTSDQPDNISGFQIHAIYVVPSDGVDHSYDTNGYIAGILDEGNNYLRSQIGYGVPIDRTATGYDIQFLKSKLSTADLKTSNNLPDKLLAENMSLESPGLNRKDYIFFIDVSILADGNACGIGTTPGMSAVVAIAEAGSPTGARCTGKYLNFDNYASKSWPHELFHNFGVNHTLDTPCDLMSGAETPGICAQNGTITIDKERTRYVTSSAQGQDIMKLRVWNGYTDQQNLQANCSLNPVSRVDGFQYAYCAAGAQILGSFKYCWSSISSVSLEEFVNGAWKSLGTGNYYSDFWGGTQNQSKCIVSGQVTPWQKITVTTPGISLYRWMVNGVESEQFKVIWVR